MKKVLILSMGFILLVAIGAAQTDPDSVYLRFTDRGPVPAKGMAELTNRVVYPEIAVAAGLRGTVFVTAFVNEDGLVDSTAVAKGVHPLLDSAAVRAVRETRFVPARYDNAVVKALVTVPVRFSLAH